MLDRLPEFFVWGLGDSVAPPYLAVLAWYIAACISLSRRRRSIVFFALLFIPLFYSLSLAFLVGILGPIFLTDQYFVFSQVVFLLIGGWLAFSGAGLFVRWYREIRTPGAGAYEPRVLLFAWIVNVPMGLLYAAVFAFALVSWAPTGFVTIIATDALMPDNFWKTVLLLSVYSFFKVLFLIFATAAVFMLSRCSEGTNRLLIARSTSFAIMSAFFIAVGVGLIVVTLKQF